MTPLSSISISGMDATPCPDMSVAKSVTVDLGTSMSVDFDDRMRGIERVEITDTAAIGAAVSSSSFRNPLNAQFFGPPHASLHPKDPSSSVQPMWCPTDRQTYRHIPHLRATSAAIGRICRVSRKSNLLKAYW